MQDWEEKVLKISKGSFNQLKKLNAVLEEEDFDNIKIMNEIIINEFYSRMKKISSEKRHDILLEIATDNYNRIRRKGFTKKGKALGTVG